MKTANRNLAPTGIGLPRDLKAYLEEQAKAGFRSLTREIVMRLAESRKRDEQQRPGVTQ